MEMLKKSTCLSLLCLLVPLFIFSQKAEESSYELKPLLDSLETTYNVSFSYDSELIAGIKVDKKCDSPTLDDFFTCISNQSILKFEAIEGGDYMIIPSYRKESFQLNVRDNRGDALYGVYVFQNGRLISTSDITGNVQIPNSYTLNDTISFKSFGLLDQVHLMKNLIGQFSSLIVMELSSFELEEIVIESYTAEGVNMVSNEHGLEIQVNELSLLPGETDGDIFMSLQTIPGITTVDGKAGNLYIRGSTPDQNLILFDHIPIYHTGHYFGTISPYNPKVVDKMNVYRTGFSPEYGGRIGSTIDMKSRSMVADSAEFHGAINTLYGSASVIAPIGKKITLQVAGRSSFPSKWLSPKLEAVNEMLFTGTKIGIADDEELITRTDYKFHFHDFNTKLIADIGSKDKLLVSFMNIDNSLEFTLKDDLFSKTDVTGSNFLNNGLSIQWNRQISDKLLLKTVLAGSDYQYDFYQHIFLQDDNSVHVLYDGENEIIDYSTKFQADIKVNDNVLETGVEVKYSAVSYSTRTRKGAIDSSFFNGDDASFIPSMFANYNLKKEKLNLNIGGRASYYSLTEEVFFEPRVFASYKVNKKVTLKGSSGVYAQYLSHISNVEYSYGTGTGDIWKLANEDETNIAKSWQSMLGASFTKNNWVLDLEVYNKEQGNLTYYDNHIKTEGNFHHGMAGRTYGFDVLVKKKWNKLSSWIGYTYNKSTYWLTNTDSIAVDPATTYFDQPHNLNLVGLYETGPFRFSLGWTIKSGLITGYNETPGGQLFLQAPPLPPVPGLKPNGKNDTEEITEGRFPVQHQLDFSASWKYVPTSKKFVGHIGFSILNVYNQQNIIKQTGRPTPDGLVYFNRYSLGFSPNLQLSIDF